MDINTLLLEVAAVLLCATVLTGMSKEDLAACEVAEVWCYLGWLATAVSALILKSPWQAIVVAAVLFVLFMLHLELPLWGDADYVPIAMFVVYWGRFYNTIFLWMLPLLALLLVIVPYAKWWGKRSGKGWKFGAMQMVPALPIYLLSWCTSSGVYIAMSCLAPEIMEVFYV